MLTFSIIPFILFSILIITSVNFILIKVLLPNSLFYKTINFANYFLAIHSSFVLIMELFFKEKAWLDQLAPFALMYGPILYFVIKAIDNEEIPPKKFLFHISPFLILFLSYLGVVIAGNNSNTEIGIIHKYALLITIPISLSGYSYYPFRKKKQLAANKLGNQIYLILIARILLVFASILILTVLLSRSFDDQPHATNMIRIIIYLCLVLVACMIFIYNIYCLKKVISKGSFDKNKSNNLDKYKRSLISTDLMNLYEIRLVAGIKEYKYFIDKKLSLDSLASKLKIPSHHLTQLLNIRFNQSFYTYINNLRIEYACELLIRNHQKLRIEDLATACGFNSKVSFNRHFKQLKKCTPSKYLEFHVKKD